MGRDGAVLALGGGVTGDLAGFVAATYLRGVPVVQIPTSLIAMVDAAVGGKTGVDVPAGKNLVGAFYPPRLVVADTATIASLPRTERAQGLVEAVKHGAIADATYLDGLEADLPALLDGDADQLEYALHQISDDGHTCFPVDKFLEKAQELLEVDANLIAARLAHIEQEERIVTAPLMIEEQPTACVWLQLFHVCEEGIGKELKRIQQGASNLRDVKIKEAVAWAEGHYPCEAMSMADRRQATEQDVDENNAAMFVDRDVMNIDIAGDVGTARQERGVMRMARYARGGRRRVEIVDHAVAGTHT